VLAIPVPNPPNRVGIPGAVGDGIYLMVEPLTPGDHTIQFAAYFPTFDYRFDITYRIKVE
jgi:hypothetical protein